MPIPASIAERVETFRRNFDSYVAPGYTETELRREFLDPFFAALGWDVFNRAGYAEAYKDVVHEDALKIGGDTKAPDYSFRIGGTRKFFVEAKKPAVRVKDDPAPAAQLRRYSWSAKLPLGIVADFHEFAVYDTRIRPKEGDKAPVARIFYCTFEDYAARWDEIAAIFAREAVLKGSFDQYAATNKGRRGTMEFDDAFLADMEHWRGLLARNLALRNEALGQRELNFAVQRILDRVIFLRIAEDRGIEPLGQLQALTGAGNIYPRLGEIFERADYRYNSGLFHFAAEAGRDESPDKLTLGLTLDDATLKEIIRALYYPQSPYAFAVVPADILGHVYEQFLGKVIHLTAGHQAKIEEKPEVRKAGGVYYTPTYIVDYIVKQTLGPLVAGKTPAQVAALKVLDPACGSGSFLLGAFEFLLDWHLDHYLQHEPKKWARKKSPPIYETAPNARGVGQGDGNWQLTTAERKRILLNNLHGVDIDSQAVEVTKLSLLLKVLEGEARELQGKQLEFHRVLPDLGQNIKCGNSLIGPDFYAQPALPAFDDEARFKLNAFDWAHEFPAIMGADGFDAVIGNPPYVRIQTLKETQPESVGYFGSRYRAAGGGNYDIYVCFIEKGLALLNRAGRLGFIVPHKFFNAEYGRSVRELIASKRSLESVVHFGANQIFEGATTYCCLLFLTAKANSNIQAAQVGDLPGWRSAGTSVSGAVPAANISASPWSFDVGRDASLTIKVKAIRPLLGEITDIFVGLQTSADDVMMLQRVSSDDDEGLVRCRSKSLDADVELERDWLRPVISGADVQGYPPLRPNHVLLFPYHVANETATLAPLTEIREKTPLTYDYLVRNKFRLESREKGKFRGDAWYRFGRNQNLGIQGRRKICVPRLVDRLCAASDLLGMSYLDNVDVGGVTLKPSAPDLGLGYLLGILNSAVAGWFFPKVSAPFRGGWMSANRQFLSQVPIALPKSRIAHDTLVAHVERMLKLHEALAAAKTPDAQTRLRRDIAATDRAIDQLVYQLYELTPDEIALVEAATA